VNWSGRLPFFALWVAATVLGLVAGVFASQAVRHLHVETEALLIMGQGFARGLTLGIAQVLLLRNRVPYWPYWIVLTAFGWSFVSAIDDWLPPSIWLRAGVEGALLGLCQWTLLAKRIVALLWIPAQSSSWMLLIASVHLLRSTWLVVLTSGLLQGVITGALLGWLLSKPLASETVAAVQGSGISK
jgi:hypothetical protein